MAIHHLTPPVRGGERPRLPSSQGGPVTRAIRTMRAADPADLAVAAIRDGLAAHFADADRQRFRELRHRIAERIEADLALLDALDGDSDVEEDDPAGGDICDEPHDPEEDSGAEIDEPAPFHCAFDGTNYLRRRG